MQDPESAARGTRLYAKGKKEKKGGGEKDELHRDSEKCISFVLRRSNIKYRGGELLAPRALAEIGITVEVSAAL